MPKASLPIDTILPEIADAIKTNSTVIIKAAPGAGKTTRVPSALLESIPGEILVLEPRRLAARLSAERIAEEMDERTGETVGFHIRFEQSLSNKTRIKFITEGLFLRYLAADPRLTSVGCVVLDEYHERHIHTDVALALTRWLQTHDRPDLKLILMSATLETDALQQHFPDAKVFISEGRTYPVETEYFSPGSRWSLAQSVAAGVERLFANPRCGGHILAFLPGAAEIRRTFDELSAFSQRNDVEVLELRAEIPPHEQRKVFADSGKRKIILATNVAETSITIAGVTGVVDSGVAKIAGHASWSGLPTLDIKPVSRSACIQRAGRAGRTAPGIALRLFERSDFDTRPTAEKPEITRSDLTQTVLDLIVATRTLQRGTNLLHELQWLVPPPKNLLDSAFSTLTLLGAIDPSQRLTSVGEAMARLPIHPRLSRVVIAAQEQKYGAAGALAAALLSEGMLLRRGFEAPAIAESDVAFQMDVFRQAINEPRKLPRHISSLLDPQKMKRVENLAKSLCKITGSRFEDIAREIPSDVLAVALLCGFPDRVAQVRRKTPEGGSHRKDSRIELNLCLGGGAILSNQSVVQQDDLMIALEAEESPTSGNAASSTQIRVASSLSADLLLNDTLGYLADRNECFWDNEAERVRSFSRIYYGQLVIDETPLTQNTPEVELTLFKALRQRWPKPFESDNPLQFLKVRTTLLQKCGLNLEVPDLSGDDFEAFLRHLCQNRRSFSEITKQTLDDYFSDLISPEAFRKLEELAPREIKVGSGRRVLVHYEEGKPPWVASRLQDFFGTMSTPTIANGRISLVVHLLAPNTQSLQVTSDLGSFWKNTYPTLRKEYSRRYPRHFWPENPKDAEPPPLGRIRHPSPK
jgi:ATP-dependent helicase HrpB